MQPSSPARTLLAATLSGLYAFASAEASTRIRSGIRQTVVVYKEIRRTISLVDRAVIFDVTPVHGGRWCYRRATRGAFQPRTIKLHSLILRQLIKAADRNDMTARRTSEQVRPAFAIDTPCPEVVSTAHAQPFAM